MSGSFLANSKTLYLPSSTTLPINVKNGCIVNKERKFVYILAIIAMTPLSISKIRRGNNKMSEKMITPELFKFSIFASFEKFS